MNRYKPITVEDVIREIEAFAPPELAMEGDPIGLCLGRHDAEVRMVVVALDLTSEVVEQALAANAGLIVTHHPPIYAKVAGVIADTPEGGNLLTCAENKIALFSAHTNADACRGGTPDLLADHLFEPAVNRLPLIPLNNEDNTGYGRVLSLTGLTSAQILSRCQERLQAPFARLVGEPARQIRTLAVWPGSMDEDVVAAGAAKRIDLLIAGECKHHLSLMLSERGIDLITAGHDCTENPFVEQVCALLRTRLPQLDVLTALL